MRNIAYKCDTKVTNLNHSTKKHTQYYVYMQFNAYTCNTVMQLQNIYSSGGGGGVLFTGTPVLRTYVIRAYVRNTGVPVNKTPPYVPTNYMVYIF